MFLTIKMYKSSLSTNLFSSEIIHNKSSVFKTFGNKVVNTTYDIMHVDVVNVLIYIVINCVSLM